MNPERWRKLDEILEDALGRAPSERSAFLDAACEGDAELRREVEALLASHERAGSFIEKPALEMDARVLTGDKKASLSGRTFGSYKIVAPLGAGGMGEVYLAEDVRMERRVALKLLPDLWSSDEQRVRRFQQEARAVVALNHPNIVTIYEIGNEREAYFIATELVQGETLRERIRRGALKVGEALEISVQVARALAAAHEAGVIHRDVKPENIMIRQDGYVKVLDFGLAKLVEQRTDTGRVDTKADTRAMVSTDTGVIMGTVDYMSPEQARGLRVDQRTDVWSIACVLYEMTAGRRPFEGMTKTDVIAHVLEHDPPPLARYLPDAPPELQRIVSKALSKDREERYQTVKDFLIDLRNLQRTLELEAELKRSGHSTGGSGRSMAAGIHEDEKQSVGTVDAASARTSVILSAQPTSSAEYLIQEVRRHKTGVLIALLVLAALATGASLLALRYARREQRAAVIPFDKIKVERLTNTGKASFAAVSPDGKYVVHVLGGLGQQSLWLRHIATGSDKEIVPTTGGDLSHLTFSTNGDHIFFVRFESGEGVLYQVPLLGGSARKLVHDIDTAVTFSPDGRRFAFIRGDPTRRESYLIVANSDGTNEQKLVTNTDRVMFPGRAGQWGPAWSPDGERIAFIFQKREGGRNYWSLMSVRVKDGTQAPITSERWSFMSAIAWVGKGTGLLVVATEEAGAPRQIWHVAYPSGAVRKITNDVNNYSGLSVTADSSTVVTVPTELVSNIWVMPDNDAARAKQITTYRSDGLSGIAWTPDGRIVYTSRDSDHSDLWIMNADGSNRKQLTMNSRSNIRTAVSPDGRYIFFTSNRTGSYHIWRMDVDGGNQRELTTGSNDQRPACSLDGRWVVYTATDVERQMIWKVPVDGGEPVQVTDYVSFPYGVSPKDGRVAIYFADEEATPRRIRFAAIAPEGGRPARAFDFPTPFQQAVAWTADGLALTYLDTRDGVSNIWSQPVAGGQPVQLTRFNSHQIFNYGWSRDGRLLALARGSETSDVVMITEVK